MEARLGTWPTAGWICTVQGVQPTLMRSTTRTRTAAGGKSEARSGKEPKGLPRQSVPHSSAKAVSSPRLCGSPTPETMLLIP